MSASTALVRACALPEVGDVLDCRFEIRAVLGEGGMGHVFRVLDRQLGREVALKLIVPRYLGRPERERRFLRELELGQRAGRHPHLVEVIGGGRSRDSGWPFVVMELVEGKALANRLALGPLWVHAAVHIALQVAGAVRTLHRCGVVHRDITPMNVLTHRDVAVLIDLSHAGDASAPRLAVGHPGRLTRENEFPGTHQYMPPEQARSEPAHPAMDVYAFGVTLADMLTGLTFDTYSREAFLELRREGKIKPPRVDIRVHASVPRALADLVEACTALEPGDRPTMDEVVARLGEVLAGLDAPTESSRAAMDAGRIASLAAVAIHPCELGPARSMEPSATASPGSLPALDSTPMQDAPIAGSPAVVGRAEPRWLLGGVVGALSVAMGVIVLWGSSQAFFVASGEGAGKREPAPPVAPMLETPQAPEPTRALIMTPEVSPAASTRPSEREPPPATARRAPGALKAKAKARPKRFSVLKVSPAEGDECIALRAEAEQAAANAAWDEAVKLTLRRECWSSQAELARLRIRALFENQAWSDCVEEGRESSEPRVQRWAELCQRHVD